MLQNSSEIDMQGGHFEKVVAILENDWTLSGQRLILNNGGLENFYGNFHTCIHICTIFSITRLTI